MTTYLFFRDLVDETLLSNNDYSVMFFETAYYLWSRRPVNDRYVSINRWDGYDRL